MTTIAKTTLHAILAGLMWVCCLLPLTGAAQDIPKEAQQLLHEAQQALDRKDYGQARKIVGPYLKKNAGNAHPLAYEILGSAWYREGNREEAYQAFHKGFELAPRSFELCTNLATVTYERNDFAQAAVLFEKAYRLSKKPDGELLYRAAAAFAKAEQKPEARRVMQELAAQKQDLQQPWLQLLIQTDIEAEDWRGAEQHLGVYLDRFSGEAAYWKLLGQVRIKQKNYPAAAAALEIAYALDQPDGTGWEKLANLYFTADVPLQAARCLERAYGPNPTAEQCDQLANAYARAHRPEQAAGQLSAAIQLQPSATRFVELGKLSYRAGRWQEAINAFDAGLKLEAGNGLAHMLMGYSALELGKVEAARAAFQQAEQIESCHTQAQEALRALDFHQPAAPQ